MADTLKMKCSCGGEFEATLGAYILPGGVPDKNGRVFRGELHAAEWNERHKDCGRLPVITGTYKPSCDPHFEVPS